MGDTCKDSQKPLTGIHLVQKKINSHLKKQTQFAVAIF